MRQVFGAWWVAACALLWTLSAWASVPTTLPVQVVVTASGGGPATDAANAMIRRDNPDQTDDRIAYAIKVLNRHGIVMSGDVTMRTLYLRDDAAARMPTTCHVLPVSPLLRELIIRATELPLRYDEQGPAGYVVALLLVELYEADTLPLQLPMPGDKRLRQICESLLATPGDPRTLEQWASSANASARTLARLFLAETGLTFGAWRQQARVLEAMGRLGSGAPVTDVALDLGYESVSAFSAMFRRAAGTSPRQYQQRPQSD